MKTVGLRPMHERPRPGQRVTVALKDGTQLTDCCATMICVEDRRGIVIYHGRRAIDETAAKGWWPKTPNDLGNRRDAGPIGGASVLTDELYVLGTE